MSAYCWHQKITAPFEMPALPQGLEGLRKAASLVAPSSLKTLAASLHQPVDPAGVWIVGSELEAGRDQVLGHRSAHVAEADSRDRLHE